MNEKALKAKALKYLKTTYPDAWIVKIVDMFTSGIPDILILNDGHFYAIELKVGSNKATKLQAFTLKLISKAGGTVGICYNLEEVKIVMEGYIILKKDRIKEESLLWK